jgi:predicted HicB family RNase H-like nuclease
MKDRDRYLKIVEWSEEDQCYIGRCPGVMFGGVHGDNEARVIRELSEVVDEWIETLKQEDKALPERTAGKHYSGKFVLRVGEDLHRALAVRALQAGQSLNNYAVNRLLNTIGQGESERGVHHSTVTASGRSTAVSGRSRRSKRGLTKSR